MDLPDTVKDLLSCDLADVACGELDVALAAAGFSQVAGVDEAGRGPLCGSLWAAAVVIPDGPVGALAGLDDSKRLSEKRREHFFDVVSDVCEVGVASASAARIDEVGIAEANYSAMRQAAAALPVPPSLVLVDGYKIGGFSHGGREVTSLQVVKGDRRSLAVAAASVVAKVTRDREMAALAERYPDYGFDRHKGYGTREHLEALARLGPCREHRFSFAPVARAAA